MKKKKPARIVFLDDSEDLRELMSQLLTSMLGEECRCFDNVEDFENHIEEVLRARLAILDINLGPNSANGLDAFHRLMQSGFQGKVIFFTGHARTHPQVALAEQNGAAVLEKPIEPEKLISFVHRALNEKP